MLINIFDDIYILSEKIEEMYIQEITVMEEHEFEEIQIKYFHLYITLLNGKTYTKKYDSRNNALNRIEIILHILPEADWNKLMSIPTMVFRS